MASETNLVGGASSTSSCLQKIMESKWTDVALITGCAALLVIGILASSGVFNFMGTTNAAYLSYGMYVGAALFLIAEIIKLVINKVGISQSSKKQPKLSIVNPLSQEEIQKLKQQAKLHANNNASVSPFDLETIPNPNGPGFMIADPTLEQIQQAQNALFDYLIKIIDEADFQRNPVGYLVKIWPPKLIDRADYPQDTARSFFVQEVGTIRTLPDTAK
jgi:hypothetical protein